MRNVQPGRPPEDISGVAYSDQFTAEPNEVRLALRGAVARFARAIDAASAGALELALAEALNNVAEHAYCDAGTGQVRLDLTGETGGILCRISDRGRGMPGGALPRSERDCGFAPAPADLAEGGYGWHLIRSLTTDLGYERRGDVNELRFRVPVDRA